MLTILSCFYIKREAFDLLFLHPARVLDLLRISPRSEAVFAWTWEFEIVCENSKVTLFGKHKTQSKWLLVNADCDSWKCEECAAKMVRLHQLRIIEACGFTLGGKWTFVTVTASQHSRGFDASLANLKQGWTKLAERLRRKNGTKHYVLMHEKHKDGTLHFHMLYNASLTTKWLREACVACKMGYMAKAERLKDAKSSGKYVTKYLAKSIAAGLDFPLRFKRVRYSVGFPKFIFADNESEFEWKALLMFNSRDKWVIANMAREEKVELLDKRKVVD